MGGGYNLNERFISTIRRVIMKKGVWICQC